MSTPAIIDRARLERAARIYRSNADAALVLDLSKSAFATRCARAGIESPDQRRARNRREQAYYREATL